MKFVRRIRLAKLQEEQGGFTLTEVLVTILMLTTVLFALYSLFDMSLRIFSIGNDKSEATQSARVALERMEREIRMAYPGNLAESNSTNYQKNLLCAGDSTGVSKSKYCTSASSSAQIAFGNDLNNDQKIMKCTDTSTCPLSSRAFDVNEFILYYAQDTDGNGTQDVLMRETNSVGTPTNTASTRVATPIVELGEGGCKATDSEAVKNQKPCLTFTFFQKDGTDPGFAPDPIAPPFTIDSTGGCPNVPPSGTSLECKVLMVRMQLNVQVGRGSGNGTLQKLTTDVTLRNRNR